MKQLGLLLLTLTLGTVGFTSAQTESCDARVVKYSIVDFESKSNAIINLYISCKCVLESPTVLAYVGKKKVSKSPTRYEIPGEKYVQRYTFSVAKEVSENMELLKIKLKGKGRRDKVDVYVNPSLFGKTKPVESNEREEQGKVILEKIAQSNKNGMLQLKLDLMSEKNLSAYPAVVAYLDGKALNEYKIDYYAQTAGETWEYIINVPLKYKKSVIDMTFKLHQSGPSPIEIISPFDKFEAELTKKAVKGDVVLTKITQSTNNGILQLKLNVNSNVDLYEYPDVIAYLDGKALNEYKMNYYAQLSGMTLEYIIELPAKYSNSVRKMTFKMTQNGSNLIDIINPSYTGKVEPSKDEREGDVMLTKISQSVKNGELLLKLNVKSNVSFSAYPDVIAYLDGKALNEYKINYYAQLSGMTLEYIIKLPAKYADFVDAMTFKIVESDSNSVDIKRN